ncbi:unnamed protein product [Rhizoctonia solani]|uniref:Tyrosine-protein kinase ephrin type A/B receptor-like domain-containing protein n=1 Tax=Rhizoctonia solani TaxID=456999 RepID=A0A8H2ZXV9_9AGAM|nr:unnamed protein product [Rhizoctonia solani]
MGAWSRLILKYSGTRNSSRFHSNSLAFSLWRLVNMRLIYAIFFANLLSAARASQSIGKSRENIVARATCPPGQGRDNENSYYCVTCQPGTFGIGGNAECQSCPVGSVAPNSGMGSCTCIAGYYKPGVATALHIAHFVLLILTLRLVDFVLPVQTELIPARFVYDSVGVT